MSRQGYNSNDMNSQFGRMNMGDRGGRGGSRGGGDRGAGRRFGGSTSNQRGAMSGGMTPVAKADMKYKTQEFLPRPSKTIEDVDNKSLYRKQVVISNYFKMSATKIRLHQYDLSYKNPNRMEMRKREDTREIFWSAYKSQKFGHIFPPQTDFLFNDINMLLSKEQLNLGSNTGERVIEAEVNRKIYKIRIVYTGSQEFDASSIETSTKHLTTQFLDAVVTQRLKSPDGDGRFFTSFGHSLFYHPLVNRKAGFAINLGMGLQALTGLHGAVKPDCRGGLLYNVDISHSVFYKQRFNAVEFACEVLMNGKFELNEQKDLNYWRNQLKSNMDQRMALRRDVRDKLDSFFKGMKFLPTYLDEPREYKYVSIGQKAATHEMFDCEGTKMSVAEFFFRKFNKELDFPFLPCLQVKKKGVFIPMELLETTVTPIRYKGQVPEKVLATLIREVAWDPEKRFGAIEAMCREGDDLVPTHLATKDEYMDKFGVRMDKTFQPVQASILPVPTLKFGNGVKNFDVKHSGEWNLTRDIDPNEPDAEKAKSKNIIFRRAVEPHKTKIIVGMINVKFRADDKEGINDVQYLALMKTLYNFGVDIQLECQKRPLLFEQTTVNNMEDVRRIKGGLEKFKNDANTKFPDCTPLVLFILPGRSTSKRVRAEKEGRSSNIFSQYGMIKYLCDVMIGLNSQCILKQVYDKISSGQECSTAINITLKIMAKLGVKHYDLERDGDHRNWTKLTNPLEPTLILGVDVTHAGVADRREGDHAALSVASIVGNTDTECLQYDTSVRVQSPGEERTVNMRDEIKKRIVAFTEKNSIRPAHIVVYRDGVSETEFQRTLYEEKTSIEEACKELDPEYSPTLTYIVVSKRHHTRFALPANQEEPNNLMNARNVTAGTLVEGTVTSKNYFDFFLVSHAGVMGTSRPTHYYVLHDTWAPSFAFWQTITHALTYAYVRCPKSISQPAPVMYAHLAAKRAKDYLNAYVTAHGTQLSGSNYEQFLTLNQEVQRNKNLTGMIFL